MARALRLCGVRKADLKASNVAGEAGSGSSGSLAATAVALAQLGCMA